MSLKVKLGIAAVLIGLAVTLLVVALVIANLSAIAAWIGFDEAGNLDGRRGAIGMLLNPEARVGKVIQCADDAGCSALWPIIFAAGFAFVIVTGFAYTTLLERRLLAFLQHRVGPNRVGPLGFMQPAADGVKLVFKEDLLPAGADKWVFRLAPMIKVIPILMIAAVIPMGPDLVLPWFAPSLGDVWFQVPQGLIDSNVGVLWVIAITSIATYGVVLAGWSSDNKYAMLGALRASAQMISYELSFALTLAVPVMIVGSMALGDIIDAQRNIWDWFVFQNPLAAAVLLLALLAETNRAPFDLTEAEQELTQGYMTEYSGMKFALFMMAEYLGMIAVSPGGGRNVLRRIPPLAHGWLAGARAAGFHRQGGADALRHDLDTRHAAAHPLRPFDAIWLEGDDPAGAAGCSLDSGGNRCRRRPGRHSLSLYLGRGFCRRALDWLAGAAPLEPRPR